MDDMNIKNGHPQFIQNELYLSMIQTALSSIIIDKLCRQVMTFLLLHEIFKP